MLDFFHEKRSFTMKVFSNCNHLVGNLILFQNDSYLLLSLHQMVTADET